MRAGARQAMPVPEAPATTIDPYTQAPADEPTEATAMPAVEEAFEEIEVDEPLVGIIMGSKNDKAKMQPAGAALHDAGIRYEVRVMSAHRDPEQVREYCKNARMRGLKVIIAGAGMSAALPGVAAAHTDLPVVGVPILGKSLGGLDALLSAVQMPPGVPVACVAVDGAKNAGVLAVRIINAWRRSAVIRRYTRPEIGEVWSQQRKLECWLEVELAATEAWAAEGVVPEEAAGPAAGRAAFTVEAVNEREKVTDHDVAAFVDVVAASVGEHGRWVHYGLTSSDVLDTALALQLQQAGEIVLAGARAYRDALVERALEHRDTLCVGRTHGVHAEPTTFGLRLAGFAFEADRNLDRLATRSSSSPSASSPARSGRTPRCRPRSRRG